MTDYTDIPVGTVFTERPNQDACMRWSEFLAEYFVPWDGQEIEGITLYEDWTNAN